MSLELLVAVNSDFSVILHCVKSVQIRSYFWSVFSCIQTEYWDLRSKSPQISRLSPNTGKYGPEITPCLDTFNAVNKNHDQKYWNTHDIRKKIRSFQKVQFLIKGYNETYRLDRNSKGSGITLFITEDIPSKPLSDHRKKFNRNL